MPRIAKGLFPSGRTAWLSGICRNGSASSGSGIEILGITLMRNPLIFTEIPVPGGRIKFFQVAKSPPVGYNGFAYPHAFILRKMQDSKAPKVSAIVIADQIFQDRASSKHVISGTFANFSSPAFPIRLANCGVYVALTDVVPKTSLTLSLRSVESGKERLLAKWEIHQAGDDGRELVEISAQLANLPFDSDGWYEFLVKHGDHVLGSRSIKAIAHKGTKP